MIADAADGFSGLREWAEPIIFDRMLGAYGAHKSELKVVWRLARMHARAWRALIDGNYRIFEERRGELAEALAREELDLERIAEADAETLRELLAVVVDRFHRTPRISMSYHLALLELAGRLSPVNGPLPMAA